MNPQLTDRILLATAAGGVLLVGVAFALFGGSAALAAAVGAVLALTNWVATRFLAKNAIAKGKGALLGLMGFKTATLGVLCWICITRLDLHFFGFTLGISALVIGVVLGPMLTPTPPAATPAEEI